MMVKGRVVRRLLVEPIRFAPPAPVEPAPVERAPVKVKVAA